MSEALHRRDFLKLGGLTLGGMALGPSLGIQESTPRDAIGLVRVTIDEIRIYDEPSYQSNPIGTKSRDQLVYVYEKFTADGPDFNPVWYRLNEGYAHTAYLQPVETRLNEVLGGIREGGQVFEVTVPLTQSYQQTRSGWEKLYRLYYLSTHWVHDVVEGRDGALWYKIVDELLFIDYYVLAAHMRPVADSELSPLSPEVPAGEKRVEVSIPEQRLWAYEGDKVVLDTKVATGIPELISTNGIPTATPRGNFNVMSKMPVRHMGNGQVTSEVSAYELPGVPWVSYFHETGVAFHGTYWHDNYGNEMSHGCVNMHPEDAKWIFRWLTPASEPDALITKGYGTRVVVI